MAFIRKNFFVILILASFLGISVFHLFMMDSMASSHACFGAVAGVNCPTPLESNKSLALHISAMQSFLQVLPQPAAGIFLTLLAVIFLLGGLLFLFWNDDSKFMRWRSRLRLFWRTSAGFQDKIGSWLTLLEKRDPAHSFRGAGFEFAGLLVM